MPLASRRAEARRVLVVDDEQSILHAIEDILEDDYEVVTSTNGHEALDILKAAPFAVVLSDQRMPEITGDRFLAEARKISEATRIMITGYADLDAICKAVNEGQIYAYVAKPWDPRNLRVIVSRAADRYSLAEELHKERQLLHALMENTPDSVYFKDEARRYIAANKACGRMLGVDPGVDLVGRRTEEVATPRVAALLSELEEQVLTENRPVIDQLLKSNGNPGHERWYSVTQVPLRTHDNATSGVVSVARDVTDRIHTEIQLRESRERFKAVLDGTPALIYLKDIEGRFVIVNKRYAETFGLDVTEIEGRSAHELFPAAVADEIGAYECEILASEQQMSREIRMHDVAGRERTYFIRAVPILDEHGNASGICGVQADMTEQQMLAEQLRQSQKMESIGQLTGGIAHDFNNLLTIILGNLEILNRKLIGDDGLRSRVETARSAVMRGQSLTRQLLAFARKQELAPEVISVSALFKDIEVLISRTLGQGIDCRTISASKASVNVDPGLFESAILNLCINARDAMPDGGRLVVEAEDVRIGPRNGLAQAVGISPGDYVVIAVSDTGSGIPAELMGQIFEPFFTTKAQGKGTGLGLSMVHGFVHQSGGGIRVYSEPGVGTTFRIYLPTVTDTADDGDTLPSTAEPTAAGGHETILLVEDDEDVRDTAVAILEDLGYRVVAVADALAALEVAQAGQAFDLLFTDIQMPGGMNGAQLADALRAIRPQLPILFTSGYTANVIESLDTLPEGSEFLSKPYLEEQLEAKIRAALAAPPR